MRLIKNLKVGEEIVATKHGKKIVGTITKLLPGAAVIYDEKTERTHVVDVDRIENPKSEKTNKQKPKKHAKK